jgi:hypothetical protein
MQGKPVKAGAMEVKEKAHTAQPIERSKSFVYKGTPQPPFVQLTV